MTDRERRAVPSRRERARNMQPAEKCHSIVQVVLVRPDLNGVREPRQFRGLEQQALSGIAKDLTKMSARSFIKMLVPEEGTGTLFKWVAVLTAARMP